jgi:hypothetical protein
MQTWAAQAQANFSPIQEDLSAILQNIQANQIAGSYEEALTQLLNYANTANNAIADGMITASEMQTLAQMGANASASLSAQSIPGAEALAGQIANLNQQMAVGNLANAQTLLGNLQAQMPQIPGGGLPRPGGSLPNPGGSIPRPGGGGG